MTMMTQKQKLYLTMVESALAKRRAADALLQEAELTMVKARELLGEDYVKEDKDERKEG